MSGDTQQRGDFGGLLRRRRVEAGLTQEELAERAGLSERTIRDLERGITTRPRRQSIGLLAGALRLTGGSQAEFTRAARPGAPAAQPAQETQPIQEKRAAQEKQAAQKTQETQAAQEPLASPASEPPPGPPPPRQLPPAPADFTGRAAELNTLSGLLDQAGGQGPGTVVVSAIGGTAGVGKTALAVRWAHQVAGRFPDGQLYVNLRGYDPDRPLPPAHALDRFLRALGVPGADIPAEAEERAARYRSLLAGRRMLVLLDNAGSAEQVRPLLPATPGCMAVVTSRDALAGLVARDGARRLDLDLLSPADADVLLTALIGDRAAADPDATTALAARCARLPLALRVAAELAAARAGRPLGDLVDELAGQQRLDLLAAGGNPRTAVRAVFSWSYRHLDAATARAFRLVSLHPGLGFDGYAAAALTGGTLAQTRQLLDLLTRAHLADTTGPDRYGLHDLLRDYARELAAAHDGADGCRAALTRLADHYLYTASTALDILFPAESRRRPRIPRPAGPVPPLADAAAARAWLDRQRGDLIAVAGHAVRGWPGHVVRLSATLFRYLDIGGHFPEATIVHGYAREAARMAGDRVGEAAALNRLGTTQWRQEHYAPAVTLLHESLALYRQTSDRRGEASTLTNLGTVEMWQGHYQQAAEHHRHSLSLSQQIGDRFGEAHSLGNLGAIELRQGDYENATEHLRQALDLCREIGDQAGELTSLTRLGSVEIRQGRYRQAAAHQQRALTLHQQTGDQHGMASALINLATIDREQGRYQRAARRQRQALALQQQLGGGVGEAQALNGLGEVLLAAGRPSEARARHTTALELATQAGVKDVQAHAHDGLGHAHQALGQPGPAGEHWRKALDLYTELGAPEADRVQARLARLKP